MRRIRCRFCSGLNTKKYGLRTKKIKTSQGIKPQKYQRWYCKDCKRSFRAVESTVINPSLKIKALLHFDTLNCQ